MFDGNIFFDEQGMPILKIALNKMLFDDALPEPFSVATQLFKALIDGVSKIPPPWSFKQFLNSNTQALKDNELAASSPACIDPPYRGMRRLLSSWSAPARQCRGRGPTADSPAAPPFRSAHPCHLRRADL